MPVDPSCLVVGVQSVRFNAEHDFVIAAAVWLRRFFLLTVLAKQRYSSANISATCSAFFSAFMKALFSLQKRLLVRTQSDV